jgi:hypothetical protein
MFGPEKCWLWTILQLFCETWQLSATQLAIAITSHFHHLPWILLTLRYNFMIIKTAGSLQQALQHVRSYQIYQGQARKSQTNGLHANCKPIQTSPHAKSLKTLFEASSL